MRFATHGAIAWAKLAGDLAHPRIEFFGRARVRRREGPRAIPAWHAATTKSGPAHQEHWRTEKLAAAYFRKHITHACCVNLSRNSRFRTLPTGLRGQKHRSAPAVSILFEHRDLLLFGEIAV
jgi:hypothetical protein